MDLSEINGIGPARARWLKATFGVRTVRDLAALSPNDIEDRLKVEGPLRVSRATIESWLAQARRRASQEKDESTRRASPKKSGKKPAVEKTVDWRPVASFVLEFQSREGRETAAAGRRTVVHYVEQDLDETWPGLDCDALCRWVAHNLRTSAGLEAIEPGPVQPPPSRAPGAESEATVRTREPKLGDRFDVHVIDGDGIEDAHLVRIDKPWWIEFSWSLGKPVPAEAHGEWWLDVLLTSVGRAAPLRLRDGPLRLPANRPWTSSGYRYRFEVEVGVVTSAHLETVYRASATVMFLSADEDRVLHAGMVDIGPLRFYAPPGASSLGPSSIPAQRRL